METVTEKNELLVNEEGVQSKPWVDVIQGNRNLNRGMTVEFGSPKIINGEIKIVIEEVDVAEELELWEHALILFSLGEPLSMNVVMEFMEKIGIMFHY